MSPRVWWGHSAIPFEKNAKADIIWIIHPDCWMRCWKAWDPASSPPSSVWMYFWVLDVLPCMWRIKASTEVTILVPVWELFPSDKTHVHVEVVCWATLLLRLRGVPCGFFHWGVYWHRQGQSWLNGMCCCCAFGGFHLQACSTFVWRLGFRFWDTIYVQMKLGHNFLSRTTESSVK
jgi:hypothetical protein